MKRHIIVTIFLILVVFSDGYPDYKSIISEGFYFYKLGQYDESISKFKEATEINSQDPIPYRMIGLSYYRKEDFSNAIIYLSRSLLLEDKENVITLSIMGNIYHKLGKYYNAINVYEKIIKLTNDVFSTYKLMDSYEKVNELDKAISTGEKFLEKAKWGDFKKEIFISKLRKIYLKKANSLLKENKKDEYEKILAKIDKLKEY